MPNKSKSTHNQFHLLKERRFRPFFLTQFFGAFNDNVFKNALFITIAFHGNFSNSNESSYIINLAAILFIAPCNIVVIFLHVKPSSLTYRICGNCV